MKKILIPVLLTVLYACNSKQEDPKIATTQKETPAAKASEKKSEKIAVDYETSAYDDPKIADRVSEQKENLKELSEKKVFLDIHTKLLQKLPKEQQSFFLTNTDYEVLSIAKGSLFEENSNDFAFIVYDKKKVRISIVLYNGITSKYAKLYEDIKVVNGVKDEDSGNYSFGTSDYQFAYEHLIYNKDYLEKSTGTYLESSNLKITDISKDEDFVLDHGTFAKNVSKTNLAHTLCIATSSVYSNWDCFRYDKTKHTFILFYSQAFAD
ncbi:hypothetical protein [Flavobacterium sp.]|uniref:hypothetical protein n=1 Tax=Flavobacterium sp. TaxID=239 RepID=UPI0025BAC034|nr:hypothetical protein [Flavobacterium sp.]